MNKRSKSILLIAPLLGACMGDTSGSINAACRPLKGPVGAPLFPGSIFTIVMENKHQREIIRPGGPPYTNQLAREYASSASYYSPAIHPSLPNYLFMTAGQNFGIVDDNEPDLNHIACTAHLADQLEAAGLSWRTYQESMGAPCGLTTLGRYYPKHNPFVYYDDVNGWDGAAFTRPQRCLDHVVDYSQFDRDLAMGTVPRYVFITPDDWNDTHDGSILEGDAWLSKQIPKILASPAFTSGGVLFLTYDEGSLQTDHIPMVVASPYAKKGYVSEVRYDHVSFLKTVQRILGLEELPCNPSPENASTMDDLFAVPLDRPAPPPEAL